MFIRPTFTYEAEGAGAGGGAGAGDIVGDAGKAAPAAGGVSDTAVGDIVGDAGKTPLTPEQQVAADAAKQADLDKAKTLTPEEQAAKDAADKAAKVPDKYEFKAPEGVEYDKAALEAFEPVAKDLGLTQDQAQKLVDLQTSLTAKATEAGNTAWQALQTQWVSDAKADKEFGEGAGGKKFAENMAMVAAGRDAFGDADFVKALKDSGMGNHPAIVRYLFKVGKAVGQGSMVTGSSGGRAAPGSGGDGAIGARIYTNTKFGA